MLDANTAVAVGASGTFIKSTDAGVTWTYTWTKTHVDLLGVLISRYEHGICGGKSK